jgi:hypothetical protein
MTGGSRRAGSASRTATESGPKALRLFLNCSASGKRSSAKTRISLTYRKRTVQLATAYARPRGNERASRSDSGKAR